MYPGQSKTPFKSSFKVESLADLVEIDLDLNSKSIAVRVPSALIDFCRDLPGAKWVKPLKTWRLPMTDYTAIKLLRALRKIDGTPTISPKCKAYLKKARNRVRSAPKGEEIKASKMDDLGPIPITRRQPWLHQLQAYHFAFPREAAMLDMDMGTGKTKVVIDLIMNRGHKMVLIGAPLKVLTNMVWEEQFEKHWDTRAGPLDVVNLDREAGNVEQRTKLAIKMLNVNPTHTKVILINYEALVRHPFKAWAKSIPWDLVVAEESHRIKGAGSKASMAMHEVGANAKYRLCMSGTPMDHTPLDVYAQFRFLDSGLFGTNQTKFRNKYAIMGGFQNRVVLGVKNEEALMRQYFRIAYRVDESVQDLPPVVTRDQKVDLEPDAMEVYTRMSRQMVVELNVGSATTSNALTKMLRLQQITGGHLPLDPSDSEGEDRVVIVSHSKENALEEILEDMGKDEPVVIFCRFVAEIDAIKDLCRKHKIEYSELSGRTDRFLEWKAGKTRVLIAQIRAGSLALDCTRARYVVYYSLTFSLSDYRQSRKRVHRPGQTRTTFLIHLLARATIDVHMKRALKKREDVVNYVLSLAYKKKKFLTVRAAPV